MFLLAHNDVEIKERMYKLCRQRIIAAVGPKLNSSKSGAPGSQIKFLLRYMILTEIAVHGLTSNYRQVKLFSL